MFNIFNKKKPEITLESVDTDEKNVVDIKVFKDGIFSHSVKTLIFPQEALDDIAKIQEKLSGRKSLSKKS